MFDWGCPFLILPVDPVDTESTKMDSSFSLAGLPGSPKKRVRVECRCGSELCRKYLFWLQEFCVEMLKTVQIPFMNFYMRPWESVKILNMFFYKQEEKESAFSMTQRCWVRASLHSFWHLHCVTTPREPARWNIRRNQTSTSLWILAVDRCHVSFSLSIIVWMSRLMSRGVSSWVLKAKYFNFES